MLCVQPLQVDLAYSWIVLNWLHGHRARMVLHPVTQRCVWSTVAPWLCWSHAAVLHQMHSQAEVWRGVPGGLSLELSWRPSKG